jgi:hypothetical protein
MKKIFCLPLLIVCFWSCQSRDRVSKEVFDEVNKSMKIKKLSDVDINNAALKWGESLSQEAQNQLMTALQEAISASGAAGAVQFCNIQALPLLDSLGKKDGVSIRRVSNRYRNPKDKPLAIEQEILEAYEYNAENGINNEPNIQKINNGDAYLYTKAITIPGALCLNCHGSPDKDIQESTLKQIQSLYPDDKATGHGIGDLRGMWSISMPRKAIVKNM